MILKNYFTKLLILVSLVLLFIIIIIIIIIIIAKSRINTMLLHSYWDYNNSKESNTNQLINIMQMNELKNKNSMAELIKKNN